MPSTLVFPPGFRITNSAGRPISGGELRFFDAGTSTPKVVYSDASLSTSLGSVVYTGSSGFPVASEGSSTTVAVYTGTDSYKLRILDDSDVVVWEADNLVGAPTFENDEDFAAIVPVVTSGSDHTFEAADKGKLFNYQSNTATFPAATTLGDNWNVHIRNGGSSGRVILSAPSGISYQGTSYTTIYLEPGQAISVACDGSAYRAYSDAVLYTPAGFRPNTPGVIKIADRITAEPSTSVGSRYIVTSAYSTFSVGDIVEEVASGVFVGYTPPADCGWIAYVQDEDAYYSFIGSSWVQSDAGDGKAGRIEIAVQSEMEAASSTTLAVTPGRQHFHPGHPKAGGNFNGSGTPAFRSGDYGMGAVTDNGLGDYTVAFDTAFNDTNYWLTGWARNDAVAPDSMVGAASTDAKTASSIRIGAANAGNTRIDSPEIGLSFWGDYA